jgi:hypothetical protein
MCAPPWRAFLRAPTLNPVRQGGVWFLHSGHRFCCHRKYPPNAPCKPPTQTIGSAKFAPTARYNKDITHGRIWPIYSAHSDLRDHVFFAHPPSAKVKDDNEVEVEVADGVKVRVVQNTIVTVLSKTEPAK